MRWILLLSVLAFAGCAGSDRIDTSGAPSTPAAALAELATLPAPENVDAAVWESLRRELARVLATSAPRTGSAVPTDDASAPLIAITYGSGSGGLIQISHNLKGDYDQNGEVNIADLTPLGVNFGEAGPFDPGSAEALIDGDGNGEINLADITPIGQNFGASLESYALFGSAFPSDYPAANGAAPTLAPLATIALSELTGQPASRRNVYHPMTFDATFTYWVRPFDGANYGTPSAAVSGGFPPRVHSITVSPYPVPAGAVATVTANVEVNASIPGPPSIAWQVEGGGTIDAFGNPVTFTAPAAAADTTVVIRVAVADGENEVVFAEREVLVWAGTTEQWHSQTVASDGLSGYQIGMIPVGTAPHIAYEHQAAGGTFEVIVARGNALASTSWNLDAPRPVGFSFQMDAGLIDGKLGVLSGSPLSYMEYTAPFGLDAPFELPGASSIIELALADVNGQPGAAFLPDGGNLSYMRAFDYSVDSWDLPIEVATTGTALGFPSVAQIDGRPAVAWVDQSSDVWRPLFVISGDVAGSSWGAPIVPYVDPGNHTAGRYMQLLEVDGRPALAFQVTGLGLVYLRADDSSGDGWSASPVLIDAEFREGLDLAIVGGLPAVAYDYHGAGFGPGGIRFAQALDSAGSAWGAPEVVDGSANPSLSGTDLHPALAEIDGKPAVAYFDSVNQDLKYAARY